jgi:small subunit ribosomal protein S18
MFFIGININRKQETLPKTINYTINYKNINLLRRYIGVTGKILPRRFTTLTAKEHRFIAKVIRQSRRAGLLPFVWLTYSTFKNALPGIDSVL